AEPDYGGRIDHPAELAQLGTWQIEALRAQGADPLTGRKLQTLFQESGLTDIEVGVLGGLWDAEHNNIDIELEQKILGFDLGKFEIAAAELNALLEKDAEAWKAGKRTLFIPTFYALGRKP
ncbi:MAG: hypothetical protein JXB38_17840, partial [Anaerolineales bacterium]|nr:hypothetical protein [Anaerolineales bacterium]